MTFHIYEVLSIYLNITKGTHPKIVLIPLIAQMKFVYKFPNFRLHQINKITDLKFS